jgi:hypothetical protein
MRWLAVGALLCALAAATLAAPAQARPRAAIAFLPYEPDPAPLLQVLAKRPGMAIGLTSPTVGGFKPAQMALDMSQGARIPTRLYDREIPPLPLVRDRLANWELVRGRAADAPADLAPGLLAQTIEDAGMRAGYAGVGRRGNLGAIVAADEGGRVWLVTLGSAADLPRRAVAAWNDAALLVVDLPRGRPGLRALDALLRVRGPADFVYVVRAPEGKKLRLLASGVEARGVRGQLRSATTRRSGLIAATDVAPTVLQSLGLRVPDKMQGEPIEARGAADPAAVAKTAKRLSDVSPRRGPALFSMLGLWLVLLVVVRRRALRLGFLAALWFPGIALLTAALEPGGAVECAVLAFGSFGLAALTDRLVPWPAAPAVPAAIVFVAHTIDLGFGSPLIGAAITGPNPAGGARFYGVGNELEVILAVSILVGTGAALARIEARRESAAPGRRRAVGFAAAAVVAAGILGSGRLGADVGAVIALGGGGAAAALAASGARPSRRALAFAVTAPLLAVGVLILLDVVTGGSSHLSRSVVDANGSGDLWDVLRRRFEGSVSGLTKPGQGLVFAISVAGLGWMAWHWRSILTPVQGIPAFRAGLIGAFAAVVAGALGNDSGPLIAEIGAVLLGLAVGYACEPSPNRLGS